MYVKKRKYGRVPKREWTWNENDVGCEGVHTFEGKLVWYRFSGNPHGSQAAANQHFADFLEAGPAVEGVPPQIASDVRSFLLDFFVQEKHW